MLTYAKLTRFVQCKNYTLGSLKLLNGSDMVLFECFTLELPYINNAKKISSIVPGTYQCSLVTSPKFGLVFQIKDVPNRSNILIHKGNFVTDTKGCILVGTLYKTSPFDQSCIILNSAKAFDKLMNLSLTKFELEITDLCL